MMDTGPLVLARVGDIFLAFPVTGVREVLDDTGITEVPLAPAHILGLINVRGQVVSVVDARTLFGLPDDSAQHRLSVHLLIGQGDETRSLLVDEVLEVIRPDEQEFVSVPPGLTRALEAVVLRVIRQPSRLILVCSTMAIMHEVVRPDSLRTASQEEAE